MSEEKVLTGKPSIDKPWMKYYPPIMLQMIQIPGCTIRKYLEDRCPGMDVPAIHYYQREVLWSEIFEETEQLARAFRAAGVKEGDKIPVYLRLVPEFIPILLAAEKIGAAVVCRDNTPEENVEAAAKAQAKLIVAHSFLSEDEKNMYMAVGVEKFVLISPLRRTSRKNMPYHIKACLDTYYNSVPAYGNECIDYDDFLASGKMYAGQVDAAEDITRPLFCAYTSGSTGPSKQVIHSAETMLGIVCQMNFYGGASEFRPTWMVTCLPPALVAVVVAMVIMPLASNKLLIMDPFVFERDVDLELMYYKPNNWPLIPMFIEYVMRNGRMTKDYDLSHLVAAGAGSEALNNNQLKRAQQFLLDHNCKIRFTTGYGCSEAGSNVSLPMAPKPLGNGNVGVPMPLATISIFKPGTQEELTYNTPGEICLTGPGIMLGYDNPEATAKSLQRHADGKVWLHLGDIGMMDEDGVIYTMTRGASPRYGGGDLAIQTLENKLADADVPGIDDEFFVIIPDDEHEGYFIPYLYVVLKNGYTIADIKDAVDACLDDYMKPVDIIEVEERPFFHFKTNRIGLTRELQAMRAAKKQG